MSGTYALVALLVALAGMVQVVWHNGAWRANQEAAVTTSVDSIDSASGESVTAARTADATQQTTLFDGAAKSGAEDDAKSGDVNSGGSLFEDSQSEQTEGIDAKEASVAQTALTSQNQAGIESNNSGLLEQRTEELRKQLRIPLRPVVVACSSGGAQTGEGGTVSRQGPYAKGDLSEGKENAEREGCPLEGPRPKEEHPNRSVDLSSGVSENAGARNRSDAQRDGGVDGHSSSGIRPAHNEKVQQQREVVRAAAENARKFTERIREVEERTAKRLGVTPPSSQLLRGVIRKTLVEVARGEKTPEEAERTLAQELVASGKVASEEEAQALTRRVIQREIAREVRFAAEELARVRRDIIRSPAEEVLADSDGDGLSDFEEKVLWGTDPRNPYTAGDILSDAERVLLGLDPLSTTTQPVPAASPREEGEVLPAILEVSQVVAVALRARSEPQTQATTTTPRASLAEERSGEQHATSTDAGGTASQALPAATSTVGLTLEGRAIPNTTAWLYIFSTPIVVAVRADETGVWRYTLRRELPDGEHEVYVAILNASGAIVAKSPPARFIKQAQAVTYIPPSPPKEVSTPERSLLDTLRASVVGVALVALGIVGLLAVMVVGLWRLRAERGEKPQ